MTAGSPTGQLSGEYLIAGRSMLCLDTHFFFVVTHATEKGRLYGCPVKYEELNYSDPRVGGVPEGYRSEVFTWKTELSDPSAAPVWLNRSLTGSYTDWDGEVIKRRKGDVMRFAGNFDEPEVCSRS